MRKVEVLLREFFRAGVAFGREKEVNKVLFLNPDEDETIQDNKNILVDRIVEMLEADLYLHTVVSNMNGHIQKTITDSDEFPSEEFGLFKKAVNSGMFSWQVRKIN